ncbi:MAG: response regulator [Chloroflexi bacterium]|nr:response regulator [Chloroflexota bacterium]
MTIPLRVLILEDRADDVELVLHELQKAAYSLEWRQVETETGYLAALDWPPDIILADYNLPQFNALRALHLLQERNLEIAFIVVTNSISEEIAVKCVQEGAEDYLLKDRLARLNSAVARALEQVKNRQQRKQAEMALLYSETLNRTILNSVTNHLAVLDRQGNIIRVNEAWERFAKENGAPLTTQTGVGVNYLEICRQAQGETRQLAQAALVGIEGVLSGQQAQFTLEYPCHSLVKDHWYLLHVTPMPSSFGGVVVSHINITERKQAEEQLRQQDRLAVVGQLAAGIAHDFNNILSVITLYAQLLLKSPDLAHSVAERLQIINNQAYHAARLIAQIMDFSRQSIMEPHPLELNQFLKSFTALLKRTLPENILIQLQCDRHEIRVHADLMRLEQVFMNLAINARDAMPNGGTLTIQASCQTIEPRQPLPVPGIAPGQWIRIVFADTGVGILRKDLARIFEPFFSTKVSGKSAGLGLAQVHGIIKQHNGFIHVTSQVDHGTKFTIFLPALSVAPDKVEAPTADGQSIGHGETILVVEDEYVTRGVISEILQALNYKVLLAKHGQEALMLFEKHANTIALVLSDMIMPVMDGMNLYYQLIKQAPHVKMIIMTGYTPDTQREDLIKSGLIDWLQKPFTLQQISAAIQKSLASSGATVENYADIDLPLWHN